jgi:hypothetical protein
LKKFQKLKQFWILSFVFMGIVIGTMALYSANAPATVAQKSAAVQAWSNGFPSGPHYNLNIHGKGATFTCNPTPGGNSIFVKEYGYSEIYYIMNRKSTLTGMYVIDPCAMGESDPAKVQLPTGKYQVYARVLGKPGKVKTGEVRKVVFSPKLVDACNDNASAPIDGFGDFVDCSDESLIGLGVVTANDAFVKTSTELTRIAPVKGKNQAQPITDMFYWSGYACDASFDTNLDGQITSIDFGNVDYNLDGVIDAGDLTSYLELNCQSYNNAWIFDIADLVVYGWDYYNQGTKLVQVRFYPETTTVYEE